MASLCWSKKTVTAAKTLQDSPRWLCCWQPARSRVMPFSSRWHAARQLPRRGRPHRGRPGGGGRPLWALERSTQLCVHPRRRSAFRLRPQTHDDGASVCRTTNLPIYRLTNLPIYRPHRLHQRRGRTACWRSPPQSGPMAGPNRSTRCRRNKSSRPMTTWPSKGMRVLGIAFRPLADELSLDNSAELAQIESNLTFVGLVGMIDPPRSEVQGRGRDVPHRRHPAGDDHR